MEIVIGVVVVFVLLIVVGKLKGPPNPSTMSEALIMLKLQTEGAWITKYQRLSFEDQQGPKLKRMFDEKTAYIQQLQAALAKQQAAKWAQATQDELLPVLVRASELVKEGVPEAEAKAQALKEYMQSINDSGQH